MAGLAAGFGVVGGGDAEPPPVCCEIDGTTMKAPQLMHLARQGWSFGATKNAVEHSGQAIVIFMAHAPVNWLAIKKGHLAPRQDISVYQE